MYIFNAIDPILRYGLLASYLASTMYRIPRSLTVVYYIFRQFGGYLISPCIANSRLLWIPVMMEREANPIYTGLLYITHVNMQQYKQKRICFQVSIKPRSLHAAWETLDTMS